MMISCSSLKHLILMPTAEVNRWRNKSLHSVVFPSASGIKVCEMKMTSLFYLKTMPSYN